MDYVLQNSKNKYVSCLVFAVVAFNHGLCARGAFVSKFVQPIYVDWNTLKPVLSGHSKIDKTKEFNDKW